MGNSFSEILFFVASFVSTIRGYDFGARSLFWTEKVAEKGSLSPLE